MVDGFKAWFYSVFFGLKNDSLKKCINVLDYNIYVYRIFTYI